MFLGVLFFHPKAIDNLIEADALFILEAHGVHADPTKAERLQKDI